MCCPYVLSSSEAQILSYELSQKVMRRCGQIGAACSVSCMSSFETQALSNELLSKEQIST